MMYIIRLKYFVLGKKGAKTDRDSSLEGSYWLSIV